MNGQLEFTTRRLISLIEKGREQFEKSKSSGEEGDFFLEVKPFSDLVRSVSDEWLGLVTKWIRTENPKFINQKQIETTYEHLEKMGIQSFYPKTSRKIFLSSIQSAQFVLQSIINHLEKSPS